MFDIKWIREHPDEFDGALKRRGMAPAAAGLIDLDKRRRGAETRAQEIQTERNRLSKEIGAAKSRGEDAAGIIAKVSESKDAQAAAEAEARLAQSELEVALSGYPNMPLDDVPDGEGEDDNVEVRRVGEPRKFDFEVKDHVDVGEGLGMMDFETAAKISGARFVMLTGQLARMERALAAFMLDHNTQEFGYTEVNPPALVNSGTMYGTGQLPKFGADLFRTFKADVHGLVADGLAAAHDDGAGDDFDARARAEIGGGLEKETLWLIPTAEVPLTNIVGGEIVDDDTLPRRYTAMTWCFRSEAGAAGKDTRGMIRQHQFTKVEMVSVTQPEDAADELERMTSSAEDILSRLGLPFRTVVLCTGDMGFGARKTYDIEVWLPGQDRYREISSCSNCGDFQARRMNARYREKGGKVKGFVHTLNGSGLAVGRTLVAILENYQQADGSVVVPEALRPYMGGLEVISANG